MQYYAVIDTNVLVSALLNFKSVPGKVTTAALIGNITPLVNDEILKKYQDVLHRSKFSFDPELVKDFLDDFIIRSISLDAESLNENIPDPKDIIFYEVVMEGRKSQNAYLVTGNMKHFPKKPFIVTPKEMLDIIEN